MTARQARKLGALVAIWTVLSLAPTIPFARYFSN